MKFEVIYEQVVKPQACYTLEAESEKVLLDALENAEEEFAFHMGDDFYGLRIAMQNQPELKVLEVQEDYDDSWEAPEYYDHHVVD